MCHPGTDPLLTSQNSELLLIEFQPSQIQAVRSIDRDLVTQNIVSMARLAMTLTIPEREALARRVRFARCLLDGDRDLGQGIRDSFDGGGIDAVEEAAPNTRKVNRPCGLQFGHTPRSQPRNVAPGVGGACRLCHQATRLEIVHEASHPARRQVGGVGQVGHTQLAIRGLGKVHDRRVVARSQTGASDEVDVQISRDDLDNSHHCAPQRLFGRRKWLDGGHGCKDNLLHQAIVRPCRDTPRPPAVSSTTRPDELRKPGIPHD
jgi:hypothetical protein